MPRRILIVLIVVISMGSLQTVRADAPPPSVNLRRTVVVDVAEKTKDAVVYISTTKIVNRRRMPFGDPFWQQFDTGKVAVNSLGSGFIVHEDGYIVTNHHVIDRARQINVELLDGRKFSAELISSDPEADLAVLKISDPKPFPRLQLGDSSDLMIGEPAIAVGNPLGFSHSVSTGIVSALHRDLKGEDNHVVLGDLIQTDAAINPGNSGGPLLNAYGQVIGINTAIRGDAQNIGFAIGINRLRNLIPELMNPAQAIKLDVPIKLSEQRTCKPPAEVDCAIVSAGANPRTVRSINGHQPRDIVDAYVWLLKAKSGEKMAIEWDDGKTQELQTTAVPLPDAIVQAKKLLGLTVEQLTPMLAERNHLKVEDGLLVTEVEKSSVAGRAEIEAGDVVVQLGQFRVATLDDLSALLQRMPRSGRVRIGVIRDDQIGFGLLDFGESH